MQMCEYCWKEERRGRDRHLNCRAVEMPSVETETERVFVWRGLNNLVSNQAESAGDDELSRVELEEDQESRHEISVTLSYSDLKVVLQVYLQRSPL